MSLGIALTVLAVAALAGDRDPRRRVTPPARLRARGARLEVLTEVAARIDPASLASLGELAMLSSHDLHPRSAAVPAPAPLRGGRPGGGAQGSSRSWRWTSPAPTRKVTGWRPRSSVRRVGDAATLARDAALRRRRAGLHRRPARRRPRASGARPCGSRSASSRESSARCPSSGRAVELESGEDAVEPAARLLGGQAPHDA